MKIFAILLLVAGWSYALPQDGCTTYTTQQIVPTTTATYLSTAVVTEYATTPRDLGTFTYVETISTTKTLETLTATTNTCESVDTVPAPYNTATVYSSDFTDSKRGLGLAPRDGCTITVTSTTTYGQTQTFVPAGKTRTFTEYTAYTQATETRTTTGGKAYAIATETVTKPTQCGSVTVTPTESTATVTLNAQCSPSAMISAYNNFGIDYLSDTPASGATYETTASDASACCQLCADANDCAASAWDIRSGVCKLEFPVDPTTGELNCGEGLLGYYDAGPNHPLAPGAGWYIATVCGNVQFGNTPPDDGS
ncbi:hypothetical protein DOTSEDRAFT_71628 [Dothistroma septosporum NZE10]|uniref:Apple domain-containing protein n=1 Tax=Dothistroma septosporum (strain NZE10 / CBS 128990) TaxID=675120 RepID=N1PKK8_DOTSN|nr:hypothetical protein DOTSEDRAFT_71628 [Dothistroma septosporum NZE10]